MKRTVPVAPKCERGITLVEMMIVVAIASALTIGAIVWFRHQPYSRHTQLTSFQSALDRAKTLATTSGNGATVVKFLDTDLGIRDSGYTLLVCSGRPISGTVFGSCVKEEATQGTLTATSPAGTSYASEWALYVDTRGTVAVGAWGSSYASTMAGTPTSVASEPSCPTAASITLTFSGSEAAMTHTVDCASGTYN